MRQVVTQFLQLTDVTNVMTADMVTNVMTADMVKNSSLKHQGLHQRNI